jgi:hypothetical protein
VPQIFIGDTHVGGYDEMAALERHGKLDPLLNAEKLGYFAAWLRKVYFINAKTCQSGPIFVKR